MKKKRDYSIGPDGKRKPSVTTIIGKHLGWKTNALMGWAHKLGKEGRSMSERDEAAAKGSCAHDLVAAHFAPEEHGDLSEWSANQISEAMPNAARVIEEIKRRRWTPIAVELAMETSSFAGTVDMIVRDADGRVLIVDLKTGKGAYDETVVQLGAYNWLWRVSGDGTDIALEAAVIHAPYGADLSVRPVSAPALFAGEQAFRLLLQLHEITPQIKLGDA